MGLPGSEDSLTIGWAVSTYIYTSVWRTDRQTDGRTDVQPIYAHAVWLTHVKNESRTTHIILELESTHRVQTSANARKCRKMPCPYHLAILINLQTNSWIQDLESGSRLRIRMDQSRNLTTSSVAQSLSFHFNWFKPVNNFLRMFVSVRLSVCCVYSEYTQQTDRRTDTNTRWWSELGWRR